MLVIGQYYVILILGPVVLSTGFVTHNVGLWCQNWAFVLSQLYIHTKVQHGRLCKKRYNIDFYEVSQMNHRVLALNDPSCWSPFMLLESFSLSISIYMTPPLLVKMFLKSVNETIIDTPSRMSLVWSKVNYCNLLINLLSEGLNSSHAKNFAAADQEYRTSTNQLWSSHSLKIFEMF